jgi:hypothetical protein
MPTSYAQGKTLVHILCSQPSTVLTILERKAVDKRRCLVLMCHCCKETEARRQMDRALFLSSSSSKLKKTRAKNKEGPIRSHSFGLSLTELDPSIDLSLENSLLISPNPPWSILLH